MSHGDVNLWGIEKPMSIAKCKKILEADLSLVQEMQRPVMKENTDIKI